MLSTRRRWRSLWALTGLRHGQRRTLDNPLQKEDHL
jgi:hypothetical protein